MSTEIESVVTSRLVVIDEVRPGQVSVCTEARQLTVTRADFLKAVVDELGVIVVERSELPEVTKKGDGLMVDGEMFYPNGDPHPTRADRARRFAMRDIALAEYLDANPPTDPKVEAWLAVLLDGAELTKAQAATLAGRLAEAGIRAPEVTP